MFIEKCTKSPMFKQAVADLDLPEGFEVVIELSDIWELYRSIHRIIFSPSGHATSVIYEYDGHVKTLLEGCESLEEIAKRLQEFKGVGPKTAGIFLRDIGPVLEAESPEEKPEE